MTDYGHNPGYQPWQPDDTFDGGGQSWGGQQPAGGQYHYGDQQPHWGTGQMPQYPGGWDTTGGMPAADPYATPQGGQSDYGGGDYYGSPDAYPPPRPQRPHPQQGPPPGPPRGEHPRRREDWDPESGPQRHRDPHPFFDGDGDDRDGGDGDYDRPREGRRRGRKGGGRNRRGRGEAKRRNGCACLVVALVLLGGLGGLGYLGYGFYNDHFASAPDFEGQGHGEVTVEIPEGATITEMGNILKDEGVVKSVQAFIDAAGDELLQPGAYTLHKEMSAEAAVGLMQNPETANALIIPEGLRATAVYERIDKHLGLDPDTTAKVAEEGGLGLPEYANGNPEGFLWPSSYSAAEGTDPKKVLREMVSRADAKYTDLDLEAKADAVGMSPYKIIIIASLIEAEGQSEEEFGKVSRVIYNRLKPDNTATNGKLQFDSTINYAKGESNLNISNQDTQFDSPYNTYLHPGLPPGPIDNPSEKAINAALNPTEGNWLYFVTVKEGDTRFAESKEEHDKNVEEFNRNQRKKSD